MADAEIVQAQPSPQSFTLGTAKDDTTGNQFVMLRFNGFCGEWTVFLDPQAAKSLAAQLERNADGIQTGTMT